MIIINLSVENFKIVQKFFISSITVPGELGYATVTNILQISVTYNWKSMGALLSVVLTLELGRKVQPLRGILPDAMAERKQEPNKFCSSS